MTKVANRCCSWCHTPLSSNIKRPQPVYCSYGCRDADYIFNTAYSDEEINRRNHYTELTKGRGNGT